VTEPSSLRLPVYPLDGARGNGEALDTAAIQAVIDGAFERAGGIVSIPPGHYKIGGTLDLKSRVSLRIDPDATLIGSTQESDFSLPNSWEPSGNGFSTKSDGDIIPVLIRCNGQAQVGIFGGGTIDGSAIPGFAQAFNTSDDKYIPHTWNTIFGGGTIDGSAIPGFAQGFNT